MSRLFPEPLNERNFPPMFQDFLLRPLQPPIFNAPTMQDLPQELDTLSITTKVKEKLATHNLGQKVRNCLLYYLGCSHNSYRFYRLQLTS